MRHLSEKLWASDEVMAVNAELGLTMEQLTRLGQAMLAALSTPPAPRAPSIEPVGEAEIVGDTRFEGWLSEHEITDVRGSKLPMYHKQDMREAYWAGYKERASLAAPAGAGVEEFPLPEEWADAHNLARNVIEAGGDGGISYKGVQMLARAILRIDEARRSYSASLGRTEGKS